MPDTATAPGTLTFTPVVTASKSDGTTGSVAGPAWLGSPASTRDLQAPPASLPAGLWSVRLTIDDEADLFLGNVIIE